MPLALFLTGSTQRDSLIQGDVVADDSGLANYRAHTVVDEKAAADFRAGMNFNSGEQARELRDESGQQAHSMPPKPAAYMMSPHRVQTGVAGKNFEIGARGRVRLEDGRNILAHGVEEADHRQFSVLGFQFSETAGLITER